LLALVAAARFVGVAVRVHVVVHRLPATGRGPFDERAQAFARSVAGGRRLNLADVPLREETLRRDRAHRTGVEGVDRQVPWPWALAAVAVALHERAFVEIDAHGPRFGRDERGLVRARGRRSSVRAVQRRVEGIAAIEGTRCVEGTAGVPGRI